jgi:DNA-binding Lrp family transcriptional regulator
MDRIDRKILAILQLDASVPPVLPHVIL